MNIGESLPRNAQHFPDKRAIVDAHRAVTFREFHERTNRLANYLLAQGICKGDLVGLSCGSRAEHFEALFAVAKIGAIAVPFDFNWSAQECEAMLGFFAPKAFFLETRKETDALTKLAREHVQRNNLLVINSSSSAHAEPVEASLFESVIIQSDPGDSEVEVQGLDPFLLMITSGTTGFPKACSINHETYSLRCMNYGLTKGMNPDERALMALPVHFNAGRGSVMSILYLGGTIFIQEKFDATLFLETIEREKITYTMLVPTLCERLLRHERLDEYQKSSLRYLGITGGHLSKGVARETRQRICDATSPKRTHQPTAARLQPSAEMTGTPTVTPSANRSGACSCASPMTTAAKFRSAAKAKSASALRSRSKATTKTRKRPRNFSTAAGATPAISVFWITKAICTFPAAKRT